MMDDLHALVVGLGRMGTFHTRVLTDLGYHVTTVDPAGHAHHTTLPRQHYDIACVAVPIPHLAKTAALVAMTCQPTWLLIEKPGASSMDDVARYWPVLLNVPNVAIGYIERFNPAVRQLVQDHSTSNPFKRRRDVECIEFTRLNDRPTPGARLDLWSHDADLAHYLQEHGVDYKRLRFKAEGNATHKQRTITVHYSDGTANTYDLMAHNANPLRDQWEAFLAGQVTAATVNDAKRVLEALESFDLSQQQAA